MITDETAVNIEVSDRDDVTGNDFLGRFWTLFTDMCAFSISIVISSVKLFNYDKANL